VSSELTKAHGASAQHASARKRFLEGRFALIAFLLFLWIGNFLFTPNFFSVITLRNLIIQSTQVFIISAGLTFVCAMGEANIATGSLMALSAVVTIYCMQWFGTAAGILLGLLFSVLVGAAIGTIIAYLKIIPIVVTMTFMMIFRGLAFVIAYGGTLRLPDTSINVLGTAMLTPLKIPIQLLYISLFTLVFWFIANKTVFGKNIALIGDNRHAAKLCGINHQNYSIMVHAITGLMCGIAALISLARTGAVSPSTFGSGIEMDAIAVVAIGGTCLRGGRPQILGTLLGAIILQTLFITLVMHNIPIEAQMVVKGMIIVFAVLLSSEKTV